MSTRRRLTGLLLGGVSLGSTALIAAVTVTTLVAEEITGSATWSGVPMAASVLGTAAGTTLLSAAMRRLGRRAGLILAYLVGAGGALLATAATIASAFPLLVVALLIVGLGNSATALTRYLAADLYPSERRAFALSWVVWAGTVGAIVGPNLLAPTAMVAGRFGLPPLAGTYVSTALLFLAAALLYLTRLRPDPSPLVDPGPTSGSPAGAEPEAGPQPGGRRALAGLFGLARVQLALVVLVVGQVVMVFIMTMTPLHMRASGHSLESIGMVMSAHILGMFALAPLSGRLVDRVGQVPVILQAQATLLAAALLAAFSPPSGSRMAMIALFLLGLGWNFGFVAGSSLLTSGIPVAQRGLLQGLADSLVWGSAAVASLASSLVLAATSYPTLCLIGAGLVAMPVAVVSTRGRSLAGSGA